MNTPTTTMPRPTPPFTLQAARAAWISPLLGVGGLAFAGTAAQDPNHGGTAALAAGALFLLLVLCGFAFTVIGFAAATFDPANRRTLLAHSVAGLAGPIVFGGFLALTVPFFAAAQQDTLANQHAWALVEEISRDVDPTEDRFARSTLAMRAAANEATGESALLLADVARAMEELVDSERAKTRAWEAFFATEGTEMNIFCDSTDNTAERRVLLGRARTATLRWQAELRAVDAWLTPSIREKTTVSRSRREWLETNTVRGPLEMCSRLLEHADALDTKLTAR